MTPVILTAARRQLKDWITGLGGFEAELIATISDQITRAIAPLGRTRKLLCRTAFRPR